VEGHKREKGTARQTQGGVTGRVQCGPKLGLVSHLFYQIPRQSGVSLINSIYLDFRLCGSINLLIIVHTAFPAFPGSLTDGELGEVAG